MHSSRSNKKFDRIISGTAKTNIWIQRAGRHLLRLFAAFSTLVLSSLGFAQSLHFAPGKNGFQVMSQNLDFEIINDDLFRLGPTLISSSGMKLEMIGESNKPQLRFVGPRNFMMRSQILFRDPNGKVFWKKDLEKARKSERTIPNVAQGLNQDLAIYEETDDVEEILLEASKSLFFNVCLFQERESRRFNICSADYRASNDTGSWTINPINNSATANQITVNGVAIDSEAEIQMAKDLNLNIVVKLKSGLLFELRTREIPLSLFDYEYQTGSSHLRLWIRLKKPKGSPPQTEGLFKEISLNDPFFLLEDETLVNFKQEVIVPKELFANELRPQILFSQTKTYSSKVVLSLLVPEGLVIRHLAKADSLTTTKDATLWNIENLKTLRLNARSIEVSKKGDSKTFIGSVEIFRGSPWDFSVKGMAEQRPASGDSQSHSLIGSSLSASYYFSTFLFLPAANWNHLRWFSVIDWSQLQGQTSNQKIKETAIAATLGYRLQPGLHHLDPSWSLLMSLQSFATEDLKRQGVSFGLRYDDPNFAWSLLGNRLSTQLKYAPSFNDEDGILKPSRLFLWDWESRYYLNKAWSWSWGIKTRNEENFDLTGKSHTLNATALSLGLHSLF